MGFVAGGVFAFLALACSVAQASELTPLSGLRAEDALAQTDADAFEQAVRALEPQQQARVLDLLRTPLNSWEEAERLEAAFRSESGAANARVLQWILDPASDEDPLANQHFATLSTQERPTKLKMEKTPCERPLWPLDRCGRSLTVSIALASGADYREILLFQGAPEVFVESIEELAAWRAFRRGVWARLEMLKLPREGAPRLDERLALIHHLPKADRAFFRQRQLSAAYLLASPQVGD